MTFDLLAIAVFSAAAALYILIIPAKGRAWALMIASVVAIFWLQPALPIRFSDFILPALTIILIVVGWLFTRNNSDPVQQESIRQDRIALLVTFSLIAALSLFRFVDPQFRITASRPPSPLMIILGLAAIGLILALVWRLLRTSMRSTDFQNKILTALILLIVILFLIVKTEPLATAASSAWRNLTNQDISLAAPSNLAWLGFSFVAFRLIHTMRDRQSGILPTLSFREYLTYIIFFPSYTAGPIDRAERFVSDFRSLPNLVAIDSSRFIDGSRRIFIGLFKKFVVADAISRGLVLTSENAAQTESSFWLWVLLYGYSIRIYFDFAGYTDIAIGIGILFGIRLPENFDRPYLKTNIAAFWKSWHITLSNWVRYYIFTPLSRWLLRRSRRPSTTVIVLVAQVSTMVVIGLWHGVTWNFLIWGMWHGFGLFVHKIWSDHTRPWYRRLADHSRRKRAWTYFTWFITFNFVVLGWVWFALPTIELSLQTFEKLFGFG